MPRFLRALNFYCGQLGQLSFDRQLSACICATYHFLLDFFFRSVTGLSDVLDVLEDVAILDLHATEPVNNAKPVVACGADMYPPPAESLSFADGAGASLGHERLEAK